MNLRAVKADMLYALRLWYRFRANLVASLLIPVLLLVTFGFMATATAAPKVQVLVEDQDGTPGSARFVQLLAERDGVLVAIGALPSEEPASWMKARGVHAALRVPPGFGESLAAGSNASLVLLSDPGETASRDIALSAVEAALGAFNAGDRPGARLEVQDLPGAGPASYNEFLLPGVLGLTTLSVGLSTSFGAVTQLRSGGVLGRLAVSPMTKTEWILGRMIGQTLIALIVTVFLLAVAFVFFGVRPALSPWTFALVVAGTLVFAGLGTLLGGVVKRPETGGLIIGIVQLPLAILSGSFFDTAALPRFLQWLPAVSPLKHLNDGLRSDMLLGDQFVAMKYAGVLLLLALGVLILGTRVIDWTAKD